MFFAFPAKLTFLGYKVLPLQRWYDQAWHLIRTYIKLEIHSSVIPGRIAPSWLGVLEWTALWAEENRLSSAYRSTRFRGYQSIKVSLHRATASSRFARGTRVHTRLYIFALISRANLSRLGAPRFGLALRCIPGLIEQLTKNQQELPQFPQLIA